MKRAIIGILLIIIATSLIVQKEHVIKELSASFTERMQPSPAVVQDKPKHKPRQDVELMGYPAPPDEPLLPYPAPYIPTRTPLPTFTPLPFPTPAPTMNPWGD